MSTEKKDYGSWIIAVLAIVLQGAAWIWPDIQPWFRASVLIVSVVIMLFLLPGAYQSFRARLAPLLAFLTTKWPLLFASLFSSAAILGLPYLPYWTAAEQLVIGTQLVMAALLAASLSGLVLGRSHHPSVRVVKGSTDRVYLIEDGVKRHIPDSLTHQFIMLDTYRQTERVSDLELKLYPTGKTLPKVAECDLVKGSGEPIYVIWEGRRKQIPDVATQKRFFPLEHPEEISDIELEQIPRTGSLPSIVADMRREGSIAASEPPGLGKDGRLLERIEFNYEDSPTKHGWQILEQEDSTQPEISYFDDSRWGKVIQIKSQARYAMDYYVKREAESGSSIKYVVKSGNRAFVYACFSVQKGDGAKQDPAWLKFPTVESHSRGHKESSDEWLLYVKPTYLDKDWLLFEIDLDEAVEETFGTEGWQFEKIKGFRLRGNLSLAHISVFARK